MYKTRMPMSLITVASKTENYQIISLALQVSDRDLLLLIELSGSTVTRFAYNL